MDAITSAYVDKLKGWFPDAQIRLSHQFLDGVLGNSCGWMPNAWNGMVVTVTGKWWKNTHTIKISTTSVQF